MMAAEEDLIVFQGVQRSGNTLAVLPKQATQENGQMVSAQGVAEIIEPEAVLASRLQTAWGCAREAVLPAAHGLPGRCFASATASRNGLYAIYSVLPEAL
ncbi:MAG: hypothetical protein K8R57_00760 [Verrucomicrobia bacterium]|nr:hypothetical protein [Verrucomicrobiota bacterium]